MRTHFLILLFTLTSSILQAQVTVSGKVTDAESNDPLPGVAIVENGTTNGIITDANGNFSIDLTNSNVTLSFSFIGYLTEEIIPGNQTHLDIKLVPDLVNLDEVLVIGYGTQKKSVVTGSIAKVSSEDLERAKDTRIEQTLQGRTSGVMIMNNSGQPGDNLTIRIRGTGTNSDADPLFIIDGLPMEKESLDYLNSNDVESIEVLKDASSAAIYGTRGANGVVIITTKQGAHGQKFTVSYDGFYGFQNPWHKLDLLNADQYMDIYQRSRDKRWQIHPIFLRCHARHNKPGH